MGECLRIAVSESRNIDLSCSKLQCTTNKVIWLYLCGNFLKLRTITVQTACLEVIAG
jgi:hypothetical protein